jgi:hypothetical protein
VRLPEPMLAKSGPFHRDQNGASKLKLDGFRAIVCTTGALRFAAGAGGT